VTIECGRAECLILTTFHAVAELRLRRVELACR
jgi:hypothetical protein